MRLFSLLFLFLIPLGASAGDAFQPLDAVVLDKAAFAQWSAGVESPMAESEAKDGPHSVVWATAGRVDWRGTKFGAGRDVGARRSRVGFTKPVSTGSVLVSGGGKLSVLKRDAPYPGDPANDSRWVSAERLFNGGENDTVRGAPDASWRRVAGAEKMDAYYPMQLGAHWLAFEDAVSTRALRPRITEGFRSAQGHLSDKVKEGRRVWLGEMMALAPLADGAAELASLVLPTQAEPPPPGQYPHAIGDAGAPALGDHNPNPMNNPNGLAVDSQGRVWVAESDNFPRRVSVWSADGQLARAFHGPTEYGGGGGVLDSQV